MSNFVDIELDLTDETIQSIERICAAKLRNILTNPSYDMYDSHEKGDYDNLALAIGKSVINDCIVDCVAAAIQHVGIDNA